MSRDSGRDVPDLEKLYARKLWAEFSYPICFRGEKKWELVRGFGRKGFLTLIKEVAQGPKRASKAQKSHEQTAPKNCLINSRVLPKKTRVLRQIAPESSPESSAKSLSHTFFVPFLSLSGASTTLHPHVVCTCALVHMWRRVCHVHPLLLAENYSECLFCTGQNSQLIP